MSQHRSRLLAALSAIVGLTISAAPVAAAPAPVSPADAVRPHVMRDSDRQSTARAAGPPPAAAAPAPGTASTAPTGGPLREVFGFFNAGNMADSQVGFPTWHFETLSTAAFFGLHVSGDGTIAHDAVYSNIWNSASLGQMVSTAHAAGTRVVLSIIQQDNPSGSLCSALQHTATTVQQTLAEVNAKGVDGVNVDYEGLGGTCAGRPISSRLDDLVTGLRQALPAGRNQLSVDTYASAAAGSGGFYDIPGMTPQVDFFFVMAYDLDGTSAGGNWQSPPLSCASYCFSPTAPLSGYAYNDTRAVNEYLASVPASKVLLGVPYYGYKGCVSSLGVPNQRYVANPPGNDGAATYLGSVGTPTTSGVSQYSTHRDANDQNLERWDTWYSSDYGCNRQSYWDDAVSLGAKYDLVNSRNLRGVGIFTLDYGGGAQELWDALAGRFLCPVTLTLGSQATTRVPATLSASSHCAAGFDLQVIDTLGTQAWTDLLAGAAPGYHPSPDLSALDSWVDVFPGRTYQVRARVHLFGGQVTPWAQPVTISEPAGTPPGHPWKGLAVLDAYGGLGPADTAPMGASAYWPGWNIARSAHYLPGPSAPQGCAVLDGYGGFHPCGSMPAVSSPHYFGWDIARDFAFMPSGAGGLMLDGYGGVHPVSAGGGTAPAVSDIPYFAGNDIARKIVIFDDATGGYILDGYGGIHPFGLNGQAAPPVPAGGGYWAGWDIAHDLVLIPGTHAGYLMDGYGGLHPFAPPGQSMPAVPAGPYWNWDIARSLVLLPGSSPSGLLLDGWGGLHPVGGATAPARASYFPYRDLAKVVFGT